MDFNSHEFDQLDLKGQQRINTIEIETERKLSDRKNSQALQDKQRIVLSNNAMTDGEDRSNLDDSQLELTQIAEIPVVTEGQEDSFDSGENAVDINDLVYLENEEFKELDLSN